MPCGRCANCRKRKVSEWSFRLMQEDKRWSTSAFITLTYSTEHVPILKSGYMSICKRDVQLFMKRLRKAHPKGHKLKYYLCGEYGGKSWRPHYHAIMFNVDISLIQDCWSLGDVHYGTVTGASVGYSLKYISKKGKIPQHGNDDRVREFSLMSKGLGDNYLTPAMVRWHNAAPAERMYVNLLDGRKVAMARFYKTKLWSDEERQSIAAAIPYRSHLGYREDGLSDADRFQQDELP